MISSAGLIDVFNKSILLLSNYYSETICTRFVVPLYYYYYYYFFFLGGGGGGRTSVVLSV